MAKLVDLTKKPYCLNSRQIDWVENLVLNMSLDEKLRQLFIHLTARKDEGYLKEEISFLNCGGVRYNPGLAKDIYNHNYNVQKYSKIPCFIASNCESGGNGAFIGGTEVGNETKVAATRNLDYAYQLGNISAKEAKMVEVNTIFAPIVDIHHDFHNPVISTRTFGNDPTLVKEMSLKFLKGIHDNGLLSAAKHFPGDGYDERDQHLSPSINPLSKEDWDKSFGMIYKSLIEEGLDMVMAGHIKLPSYEKYFNPSIKDNEYSPATTSSYLITDLLKEQLDFNGLVLTDATHMVGLTSSSKRSEFIPKIIASGCDMILFYNDTNEDFEYIKQGYESGIISDERLNDAIRRILGLKAKLGFNDFDLDRDFVKFDENKINELKKEHSLIAKQVSDDSITLVKNIDNIFPLSPTKTKRILIVPQEDENPFSSFMPKKGPTLYEKIKEKLEKEGFEVTIFESLMDKAKKLPPNEAMGIIMNVYNNKTPIKDLTSNYDLVIQFAHFDSHNTVQRISWKLSKGTADIPWYVYELPVIFVSLCSPFHLFDVPQVKTYINCYDKKEDTIDSLIEKMMGRSKFKGVSPVDAFCNNLDCRY